MTPFHDAKVYHAVLYIHLFNRYKVFFSFEVINTCMMDTCVAVYNETNSKCARD